VNVEFPLRSPCSPMFLGGNLRTFVFNPLIHIIKKLQSQEKNCTGSCNQICNYKRSLKLFYKDMAKKYKDTQFIYIGIHS
jgi:hypothetical protein